MRPHLILLGFSCCIAFCAPADPNFTGKWRLDAASSDVRMLPVPASSLLAIEHNGVEVRCREIEPRPAEWRFTIDRKEVRSKTSDATFSSIGKWEGDAALINTIVTAPHMQYTQMDRWRISRDGARLTIHREITGPGRNGEGVLVYLREEAPRPQTTEPRAASQTEPRPSGSSLEAPPTQTRQYRVDAGTRIPLIVINSVSTKQSSVGDRIYLQTAFPILAQGRVVIPPGSYVTGTLTEVKRPGRVKGRGELYVRFDSLTLPNGVTRDFRARTGSAGDVQGELDRSEGKIKGESGRADDARKIGEAAAAGASVGTIAGAAGGRPGLGAAAGGLAGAAAGTMAVLLTRGPDIILAKGATLEMVLDRPLIFAEKDLAGPR